MKNKIIIFVIILSIILGSLVFKPFPVSADIKTIYFNDPPSIGYYDFTSSYIYLHYNLTPGAYYFSYNYGNGLNINFTLYNNSGSVIVNRNYSTPSGSWTQLDNSITILCSPSAVAYQIGFFKLPKLTANNYYIIRLDITGLASDKGLGVQYQFNVHYVASFLLGSDGKFTTTSQDISLNLSNYDCQTHIATFSVNAIGYNILEIPMVSTKKDMGQEYVISYVYSNQDKTLKVYFSSDLPTGMITLYLGITLDTNITLLRNVYFSNTCEVKQDIKPGKFYITSPPMETKFESPQTGMQYYNLTFNFAYGGNINNDIGSGWVIRYKLFSNLANPPAVDGGIIFDSIVISASDIVVLFHDATTFQGSNNAIWSYNSATNTSFISITIPIIKDYQPGLKADITFQFTLLGNGFEIDSDNSVHIIIGEPITSTGNPLLDAIYKIWYEFKNWFVNTIKFLFVPSSSDISNQLQSGWIDLRNTQLLPNVSASRYLNITMPKSLFGNNNNVQLDFGKMTEWPGWSNVRTITRGFTWLLFAYILISMVA
ncbi:MAG: hypothetical protein ACP5JU_02900 [Minisyncoccia bacterium]